MTLRSFSTPSKKILGRGGSVRTPLPRELLKNGDWIRMIRGLIKTWKIKIKSVVVESKPC